jgi:hypothetical protein
MSDADVPRPRTALPLSLACIPFGVCVMLFVIALAGRPAVFPDTDDYLEHGRNTVMTVAYALHLKARPEPPDDPDDIAQDRQDEKESHLGIAARTPWYGVWLYVWQKLGTLWLLATVQAAVAATLVWRLWRALAPRAPAWTAFAAQGVTALASTLPFFAGFAMPDVFAGFTAIAAALLLADWDELGRIERAGLALLLAYSVTLHASNALLAVLLAVTGALGAWLWRRQPVIRTAGVLTLVGAVAAGAAAASLSMAALKWTTGDAAGRPPFLQARLLSDGPGRRYLRHACAHGVRYTLCAFRKLPLDDDEEILWSDDPARGVYEVLDLDGRIAMQRDDLRFAVHTLLYDPLGVAAGALRNWGGTLMMPYVEEPLRSPHYYLTNRYWKDTNLPGLIQAMGGCGKDHFGCEPRFSQDASRWLHGSVFVLALVVLGWRFTRPDLRRLVRGEPDVPAARTAVLLGLLCAAVVLNALICGGLSGAFPRYQARIAWILVAAAAAAVAGALTWKPKAEA